MHTHIHDPDAETSSLRLWLRVFIAALFLLSAAVSAQVGTPVQPPPEMLNSHHQGEYFFRSADDAFAMRADYSSGQRTITIVSLYNSGPIYHKRTQSYPVRYWPTCVRKGANGELWVAGKGHRTGNTIVEKWLFTSPTLVSTSTPGVNPLLAGPQTEVKDIYDAAVAGQNLVENMTPRLGGSESGLLVKFHDSKDVYYLNTNGTVGLIASAVVKPNSFHCPLLQEPGTVFGRQLATGGYVYGWRLLLRVAETVPSLVVLYDDDMNGIIDRSETINAVTFDSRHWGRPDTWVP